MNPNSFEMQFLKNYSKLSLTKFFELQKTKNVGGLVLIYIRYFNFNFFPSSEGIL
jgi:hypothetical protein